VEIHVPIAPTPQFFTMLHYLAASLRLNGGPLSRSRIVVTVSAEREPVDLTEMQPWSRNYSLEWRWVPRERYSRHIYYATAVERFRYSFRSPIVLMLDADTFVAGSFAPLVRKVEATGAFSGMIAHLSPFPPHPERGNDEWWQHLFARAGLGEAPLTQQYTLWNPAIDPKRPRSCPPYFNLGMLIAPAETMNRIGDVIYDEMAAIDRVLTTNFKCQIGVAMALHRLQLPWFAADMRYNLANDDEVAARYPNELKNVRLFHYMRVGQFLKERDFSSTESVGAFLARRDLTGVNRRMAAALRRVHHMVVADSRRTMGVLRDAS
jgi:hypothetical protein